jgi:hypothetical protein
VRTTRFVCGAAAVLTAVAGCGDSADSSQQLRPERAPSPIRIGEYAGLERLSPAAVVRRYVGALNARDGRAFCRAVVPWISGRYDLLTKDRDSRLAHLGGGCPRVVETFIGFVGDTGTERFLRVDVDDVKVAHDGGLARVDVAGTLVVELVHEDDRRAQRAFHDVVWLARAGGAWRVAKLSIAARAAPLGLPGESPEEDPLSRPDVEADRRAYLGELRHFRSYARRRERTYRTVGEPADCSGGATVNDPSGDPVDYIHPAPDTPLPRKKKMDLRQVQVQRDGSRICVAMTMWGNVRGPLTASFNMRDSMMGSRFIQIFDVELRRDGSARVTSGEDDQDRPISVPAEVGRDGPRLTLVLDENSFEAGRPIPATDPDERPPEGDFAFMVSTEAPAGVRRLAHDDLGPNPSPTSFKYPGGGRCTLVGRKPTC